MYYTITIHMPLGRHVPSNFYTCSNSHFMCVLYLSVVVNSPSPILDDTYVRLYMYLGIYYAL